MYCIGCESFKKDEDLVFMNKETKEIFLSPDSNIKITKNIIKVCPDHLTTPQKIKEKNWFFRLSKYQNFLQDLYKNNPNFVIPENRFNEVKAFVDR
jgi:methionyl-tRNA synthetase